MDHHEELLAAQKLSIDIVMITVKGILIPVNWDQKGNVVSVAIATDEEKEYLVADPELAEKMKRRLRQVVEASGIVTKSQGKNIITIKQWRYQNA
jgi:hypothetical protein